MMDSTQQMITKFQNDNIKISDDVDKSMASVIGYYNEIDSLNSLD